MKVINVDFALLGQTKPQFRQGRSYKFYRTADNILFTSLTSNICLTMETTLNKKTAVNTSSCHV